MGRLGVPEAPILKGEKGEPRWPDGLVGSLTHCDGYRGAVVGWNTVVRSVGIDAEPHGVLPDGVLDAISLPAERREIGSLPAGLHWDRILFCAKEATYKAWFPLTERWLGFEDAEITFDVDSAGTTGRFTSRILIDPAARSGPPLTELAGRWSVADGLAPPDADKKLAVAPRSTDALVGAPPPRFHWTVSDAAAVSRVVTALA